jgi:hypothetical protein
MVLQKISKCSEQSSALIQVPKPLNKELPELFYVIHLPTTFRLVLLTYFLQSDECYYSKTVNEITLISFVRPMCFCLNHLKVDISLGTCYLLSCLNLCQNSNTWGRH